MSRAAARLLQALDADRSALLCADFAGLAGSGPNLARGLDRLRPGELGVEELARLVAAARRNLDLIEAAREGFRAADPARREQPRGLTTYAADGAATALRTAPRSAHDLRR